LNIVWYTDVDCFKVVALELVKKKNEILWFGLIDERNVARNFGFVVFQ
jgi:hypothetical protein